MDYTTLNRAQMLLKVAALMEKRGGEITKSVLEAAKNVVGHSAKASKALVGSGIEGLHTASQSLHRAGHPILSAGVKAAPIGALAYLGKGEYDKFRQWQLERAYRRQMGVQ